LFPNAQKHPAYDQSTLYAYEQLIITLDRKISHNNFVTKRIQVQNSWKFTKNTKYYDTSIIKILGFYSSQTATNIKTVPKVIH